MAGVEPLWEERQLDSLAEAVYADGGTDGDRGEFPRVRVGDVILEGVEPIPRCAVPAQDPDTGEAYDEFRETVIERRRGTMPRWSDARTLAGNRYSTVGTHVPEGERDGAIAVGDPVELLGAA